MGSPFPKAADTPAPPVFVVGVQRSGTTLLAAMLAAHSRLSCGPETHFFRRLAEADARQLSRRATWPDDAAAFVCSISHAGVEPGSRKSLLEKYRLDPEQVRAYLAGRAPSVSHILESVTVPYMLARGKVRWVEKTPDHLLHLPAIREHFPGAPIVRIVRDPRDVASSLTRVPWGAKSHLEGLLYWRRLHSASRDFFLADKATYTLRFEDLVAAPEQELRKLCAFLGECFEPGMLDTSATGVEINARRAPWKAKVAHTADPNRAAAWRHDLDARANRLAEALLGEHLMEFGYPLENEFSWFGVIYPDAAAARHAAELAEIAERGVRFWRLPGEKARVRVYLGNPSSHEWLGARRLGRAARAARLVARIALARRWPAGNPAPVYWVPGDEPGTGGGVLAASMRALLRRTRSELPRRLDGSDGRDAPALPRPAGRAR